MRPTDEKTHLLEESRRSHSTRLERRLSTAAIVISLVTFCFQAYQLCKNSGILVKSETIYFDPVSSQPSADASATAEQCPGIRPTIPWQSVYTLPYDMYSGLIIEQKAAHQLQVQEGHTQVRLNPDVTDTTVYVDMKLVDAADQRFINIQRDEPASGLLQLTINARDNTLDRICIALEITIELPHLAALDRLNIAVSNSDIEFIDNGVVLNEALTLETANGNIAFKDVTTASLALVTNNGNIAVHLQHVIGDITASTSLGDIQLNATEIDSPSRISLSVSKGKAEAFLPGTFNSKFTLSTMVGKSRVLSIDHPENVHVERQGITKLKGYYGASKDVASGSEIKVATVVGDATLVYV